MIYSNDRIDCLNAFGRGDIENQEQFEKIVCGQAYIDMQTRTIKGANKKNAEKVLKSLAGKLFDYIQSPVRNKEQFDLWHKNTCNWFINNFNKTLPFVESKIDYGKAQKIVNVSLKYIYALYGADKYEDHFKYCHMTLDQYTYCSGFYKQEILKKSTKTPLKGWSSLNETKYFEIQNNIRNYLNSIDNKLYIDKNNKALSPFKAEFYIFEEYYKKLNLN